MVFFMEMSLSKFNEYKTLYVLPNNFMFQELTNTIKITSKEIKQISNNIFNINKKTLELLTIEFFNDFLMQFKVL